MSEPPLPSAATAEVCAELDRQLKAFVRLVERWPNFRKHIALAMLGAAIGTADMMGCDVEGFLRSLREREPKPTPIEPGPRVSS